MEFSIYLKWSAILTIALFVFTVIAFIFGWGFRFRFFGITSFMVVLTVGIFGLNLGFFARTTIPDAVRYTLVYDNAANLTVVSIPPNVNETQVRATLQQVASDLFSPGRIGIGDDKLTIRVRTLIHPQEGITEPLYLGQVRRSLNSRDDDNLAIEIYPENLKKLSRSLIVDS
jgi:hypothetical protein